MDKIRVLLANSERGLSNLIESLILDACYNQAIVETTRISRADELVKFGISGGFQLAIVAGDNLLAGPGLRSSWVSVEQAAGAIRLIRERTATPVIGVVAFPESRVQLLEAGAEGVVRLPFEADKLKEEVRRALRLPEPVPEAEPARWSFGEFLARGLQRLKSA